MRARSRSLRVPAMRATRTDCSDSDEGVLGAPEHLEQPHALEQRGKAALLADLVEPLLALARIDLLSQRLGVVPADVAHQ